MKPTVYLVFLCLSLCCEIDISFSASIREKRDLKSDLIANAQLLISRANNAVMELVLQNRTQEAHTIALYANATKTLVDKLNASTNETEINQLKASLDNMEGYLLIEFERAGLPSYDYEELRLALIIYGEQIIERAMKEIENFKHTNQTNYVATIIYVAKLINESVNELRNATLMIDVYTIERVLSARVTRLEQVLFEDGVGWDLENVRYIELERANDLIKKLNATIVQLKNGELLTENKTEIFIMGIEQRIRDITNITQHLRNATDNNTIAQLSFDVSFFELEVEKDLAIMTIKTVSSQEREALLRAIQELSAKILDAQKKLFEQNKTADANVMSDDYLKLRDLVASVKNTVSPIDFLFLEVTFNQIEHRINIYITLFKP